VSIVEKEKRTYYTFVVLVVVVGLLLGCVAGAIAGGLSGLVVGRWQAKRALERAVVGRDVPHLRSEEPPFFMPDPEKDELPYDWVPDKVPGALVVDVIEESPAAEAGLRVGDVIVTVDQTPIDQHHQLADVIRQYESGDIVTLEISRSGEPKRVRVKLGKHPEDPSRAYLGIFYEMIMDMPEWQTPRG
jgi:S1-C subfamily serine protease